MLRRIFNPWSGQGSALRRADAVSWAKPVRWHAKARQTRTRRNVLCNTSCDWLAPDVHVDWLCDLLELVLTTPRLEWHLTTDHPDLWVERMQQVAQRTGKGAALADAWLRGDAPINVCVGIREQARGQTPMLLRIPAAVHFLLLDDLSVQPLETA